MNNFRQKLGVLLYDWIKYYIAFRSKKPDWIKICNRNDILTITSDGLKVNCDWKWSSELHAPKLYPYLGKQLMKRAFDDYPIILDSAKKKSALSGNPDISFIIGHRGKERLPHLLMTLQSIASQNDVDYECIVVEQSFKIEIRDALPNWVHYFHTKTSDPDMQYNRSLAFNAGARLSLGKILIFHDNDMLVPHNYSKELLKIAAKGFDAINIKRFIFYLSQIHTKQIFEKQCLNYNSSPDIIVQNLAAGGSLAINHDAYVSIGGFDEKFVGWGGEDIEFWERAQILNIYDYGFMPIIHLWHPSQPGKTPEKNTPGMKRFHQLTSIPIEHRIQYLIERNNL